MSSYAYLFNDKCHGIWNYTFNLIHLEIFTCRPNLGEQLFLPQSNLSLYERISISLLLTKRNVVPLMTLFASCGHSFISQKYC